jgi:hypothetical protein
VPRPRPQYFFPYSSAYAQNYAFTEHGKAHEQGDAITEHDQAYEQDAGPDDIQDGRAD